MEKFLEQFLEPSVYPHAVLSPVVVRETHISWVLLAGDFVYKIKKPIKTDFLDYTSLEKRYLACSEELRLGTRYVDDLYEAVVPISLEQEKLRVDCDSHPIEFAVRMKRFPEGSLLSQRIESFSVSCEDVEGLAVNLATFHAKAKRVEVPDFAELTFRQAMDNFHILEEALEFLDAGVLREMEKWTRKSFHKLEDQFELRCRNGFVRECHGDLHCENVVYWKGAFAPFDGIEFNRSLSCIDVVNDIAFLVMDLHFRGHAELASCLLNVYMEETGDYDALSMLRWYLVYRALVRAKVSVIRAGQLTDDPVARAPHVESARSHVDLAKALSKTMARRLWITHGVSGSGKSFGSRELVQKAGAIRIRSDIERKRLFQSKSTSSMSSSIGEGVYSSYATEATYKTLWNLAREILRAGYSVVVDATFLKAEDRRKFQELADSERLEFGILDFKADEAILRDRIAKRLEAGTDASDANLEVLKYQLAAQEPLTEQEVLFVCN